MFYQTQTNEKKCIFTTISYYTNWYAIDGKAQAVNIHTQNILFLKSKII